MTTFALIDPLRAHTVQIHIVVQPALADAPDRAPRSVMVAVGIEGSPPQMLTGTFADIPDLIDSAWRTVSPSSLSASPATQPQVIARSITTPTAPLAPAVTTTSEPAREPTQGILDLF
jgi:hypothetical protein